MQKGKFIVPTILSTTALLTIHNTANADEYDINDEADENIQNIGDDVVETVETTEEVVSEEVVEEDLIQASDVIEIVEEDSDAQFDTYIEEESAEVVTEEVAEETETVDNLEPVDVDLLGDDVTIEEYEAPAEDVEEVPATEPADVVAEDDVVLETEMDVVAEDDTELDTQEDVVAEDDAELDTEEDVVAEDDTDVETEEDVVAEDDTELDIEEGVVAEDDADVETEEDVVAEDDTDVETEEDIVAEEVSEEEVPLSEEELAAIESAIENLTDEEKALILEEDAETLEVDEAFYQDVAAMLSAHDQELADEIYTWGKSETTTLSNAISDINRYIDRNGFNAPAVTYDHIAHLPEYAYQDGKGKPDGIVIHDVGNPDSTIHDEISYMSRNWQNAFVHAFVDKDHIIEIADTDNLAWGAGRYSNQRHIQIELVHHDNAHDFAKSINNYADYVANLLYKYKLPATDADSSNGDGSIWSHEGVSHILGGTASPDPHQYFEKFGYSYDEFVGLIGGKYDDLYHSRVNPSLNLPVEEGTTNQNITVNSNNRGVYGSVQDVRTSNGSQYAGQSFNVKRTAVYNYDTYYLLENASGTIGWMHEDDVTATSSAPSPTPTPKPTPDPKPDPKPTTPDPEPETSPVVNTGVESVDATPVQVLDGSVEIYASVYSSAANGVKATPHVGKTLYTTDTITRNNVKYFGVSTSANGPSIGWVKADELKNVNVKPAPTPPKVEKPSTGHKDEVVLKNSARILSSVFNQNNYHSPDAFGKDNLFASESYTHDSVKYFGVSKSVNGARLGWVKASDLAFINAGNTAAPTPKPDPKPDPKPTPTPPVQTPQVKDQVTFNNGAKVLSTVFNQSKSLDGSAFGKDDIYVTETYTHNNVKYYGVSKSVNGARLGWVKASDLSVANKANTPKPEATRPEETTPEVSTPAPTKPVNRPNTNVSRVNPESVKFNANNVRLYSSVYSGASISANPFASSNLFATETVTFDNVKYFGVSRTQNGARLGWVREQDLRFEPPTPSKPVIPTTPTTPDAGNESPALGSNAVRVGDDVNIYYSVFSDGAISSRPFSNSMLYTGETYKHNNVNYYSVSKKQNGPRLGWVRENDLRFVSVGVGGDISAPAPVRPEAPKDKVEFIDDVSIISDKNINFSLQDMLDKQVALSYKPQYNLGTSWRDASAEEVVKFLDPEYYNTEELKYAFLDLAKAQDIDPEILNERLLQNQGVLSNQGEAFSQAAKQYGVNEIYLISHAFLETGHGTSRLSSGVKLDSSGNLSEEGTAYYNMFGIGAVDNNALMGGAQRAQNMGWDTPEKAIVGGAQFIARNYLERGQNTLYSMRWNPENPGTHQYATDITWTEHNAKSMNRYYEQLGLDGKYYSRYNLR
ncbi:N-acetylmuramoyl-L-alanine amidase [Aliicoccus persicus]|nr:N-acetylmuramoyl-L-alanine amidase [Aliicoccus persicus]